MPGSGKIFKSDEENIFPTCISLAAQPFAICQKLFFFLIPLHIDLKSAHK